MNARQMEDRMKGHEDEEGGEVLKNGSTSGSRERCTPLEAEQDSTEFERRLAVSVLFRSGLETTSLLQQNLVRTCCDVDELDNW